MIGVGSLILQKRNLLTQLKPLFLFAVPSPRELEVVECHHHLLQKAGQFRCAILIQLELVVHVQHSKVHDQDVARLAVLRQADDGCLNADIHSHLVRLLVGSLHGGTCSLGHAGRGLHYLCFGSLEPVYKVLQEAEKVPTIVYLKKPGDDSLLKSAPGIIKQMMLQLRHRLEVRLRWFQPWGRG